MSDPISKQATATEIAGAVMSGIGFIGLAWTTVPILLAVVALAPLGRR